MSKYTTGELAKECGVTVRTVQYYDTRGILVPTMLSEGGRRLYSEDDLRRMKIICFLRELGLPIDSISKLLSEDDPESVISLLIEQQEKALRDELSENQKKLDNLNMLRRELRGVSDFSVDSIGDIALIMENKKKLKNLHATMLISGIPFLILQWFSIIFWISTGTWWPFLAYVIAVIPYSIWVSCYYMGRVAYICPQCHEVFKPNKKEMFWARHTPNTRRVTCSHCGHYGFCVETYLKEEIK